MEEFRKGRDHALAFFFDLHHKSLVYFARQMVQDLNEAEDIVSDCFFKLWQRQGDFATPQNIKAFLFISCRNASLNYIQHVKVKTGAHENFLKNFKEGEENVLSLIIKTEVLEIISKEVDQLPEKMRVIFKLLYFEGKNTNEIASELQLSIQTVRNQKTKAIDLLKTSLLKKGLSESAILIFLFLLDQK